MPSQEKMKEIRAQRKLRESKARKSKVQTSFKFLEDLGPKGKLYQIRVKQNLKGVVGTAVYSPDNKNITVHGIADDVVLKKPGSSFQDLHARKANKVMSTEMIRAALPQIKNKFQKAETVSGRRVTGIKKGKIQTLRLPKLPEEKKPMVPYNVEKAEELSPAERYIRRKEFNTESVRQRNAQQAAATRPSPRLRSIFRAVRRGVKAVR
jgi:hypothetical protein